MTTPNPQYEANIPQAGEDLATSQGQFLVNFQKLYEAFSENHIALDAVLSAGNHNVVELLSGLSGFETSGGELSIYSKPIEGQTDQLFMRYQGNGTEVPITNYQLYSIAANAQRRQYFTFLPGRILVYYGFVIVTGYPFTLNLNPPIAKNIISVNFCPGVSPFLNPRYAPLVDPITPTNSIIRQLKLTTQFNLPIKNELIFYVVMANI